MKCIALTGGKQNGKDTAAKLLHDMMPGKSRDKFFHGFAWELKLEIVQMFHDDTFDYEVACAILDELKEKYPHIRQLMQSHGDYQKKEHGQDYWINKFDTIICDTEEGVITDYNESLLIVPDLRFVNELTYLQDKFVDKEHLLTLRIMRTPMPVGFVPDNHISETELNSIRADEVIENPWGDLPKFKLNLEAALIRKGWLAGPK